MESAKQSFDGDHIGEDDISNQHADNHDLVADQNETLKVNNNNSIETETKDPIDNDITSEDDEISNPHTDSHHLSVGQNDNVGVDNNNNLQTATNDNDEFKDSADNNATIQSIIDEDLDNQQNFKSDCIHFNVVSDEVTIQIRQSDPGYEARVIQETVWILYKHRLQLDKYKR